MSNNFYMKAVEVDGKTRIMGTVCHGTMRPQDLIPAFMAAVANVDPPAYEQMVTAPFPPVPAYVYDEGDNCPWWDSEDAMCVLEALTEALEAAAPEGYYFGAHPGDGSDFGYWEMEE